MNETQYSIEKHQLEKDMKVSTAISIRVLYSADIDAIVLSFAQADWNKPNSIFEQYLKEQEEGTRQTWVVYVGEKIAGYTTLTWQSKYRPFCEKDIPEIMDLNVLPNFRGRGIASKLLETAEMLAATRSDVVGIGVGLYGGTPGEGYGAAQRLYVKRGYIPDGRGLTYNYESVPYGSSIVLDDDSVLWLTKNLK